MLKEALFDVIRAEQRRLEEEFDTERNRPEPDSGRLLDLEVRLRDVRQEMDSFPEP